MQFKPEVILIDQDGWYLCMGNKKVLVTAQNVPIARAIAQGMGDIEQLKTLIASVEGSNEVAAAFGLTQFILDYGDFIAEDAPRYITTN